MADSSPDPVRPRTITQEELWRFQTLQNLITTEATLIWNRYHALLTANSIVAVVLAAVASGVWASESRAIAVLALGVFGFVLTWQWKQLTRRGWDLELHWFEEAQRIDWGPGLNPYEPYKRWCNETHCEKGKTDWIGRHAMRVIYLFLFGYAAITGFALAWLLWYACRMHHLPLAAV